VKQGRHNYIVGIVQWLDGHQNQVFSSKDLGSFLGLSDEQIRGAFTRLRKNGAKIDIVVQGSKYRFTGWKTDVVKSVIVKPVPVKSTIALFEKIGTTKTGVLILQDENGSLFRAEELS